MMFFFFLSFFWFRKNVLSPFLLSNTRVFTENEWSFHSDTKRGPGGVEVYPTQHLSRGGGDWFMPYENGNAISRVLGRPLNMKFNFC